MADTHRDEARKRIFEFLGPDQEPTPPDTPPNLTRYDVGSQVGEGAMAIVYQAHDRNLNRTVALKVLKEKLKSDSKARERFQREAQAMAGLSHPNVVTVHDHGIEDGKMFLVMEFVEGRPFRETMGHAPNRLQDLLRMLEKVARGVEAANGQGIVHRDLKPENILITADGEPKVSDFGIAHILTSEVSLTKTGAVMGTPLYMAPEQVRGEGKHISRRTDVHALGIMLYEILTGAPPFQGPDSTSVFRKVLSEDPIPPRRRIPTVPEDLETICLKALEKDPMRRYGTAGEFADELVRFRDGESILAHPPTFFTRLMRRIAKRKSVLAASFIGVLLAAGVAGWAIPRWLAEADARKQEEIRNRELFQAHRRARSRLAQGRQILMGIDRMLTREDPDWKRVREHAAQARGEFSAALREVANHPEALLETAHAYRLEEKHAKSHEYCDRTIETNPEYAPAYLERAILQLEDFQYLRLDFEGGVKKHTSETRRRRELIEKDLESATRLLANQEESDLAEGMLLMNEGQFKEAASLLKEYAERSASDPRGWYWAAFALHHGGVSLDGALHAANQALEYRPWNPNYHLMRGTILYDLGRFKEAEETFTRTLKYAPGYLTAFFNRGNARTKLGDIRRALEDYGMVLDKDPSHQYALVYRAQLLRNSRRFHEAEKDYRHLIGHYPNFARAYADRAVLFAELGDLDRAIRDSNTAIELNPDYMEALVNRGNMWAIRGKLNKALADYNEAIRLRPGNLACYLSRGNIHSKMRNWEASIRDFEHVLKRDRKRARAWIGLGGVELTRGNTDTALEHFQKAKNYGPRIPETHLGLGECAIVSGRYREAIDHYQNALDLATPVWPNRAHTLNQMKIARERLKGS